MYHPTSTYSTSKLIPKSLPTLFSVSFRYRSLSRTSSSRVRHFNQYISPHSPHTIPFSFLNLVLLFLRTHQFMDSTFSVYSKTIVFYHSRPSNFQPHTVLHHNLFLAGLSPVGCERFSISKWSPPFTGA